MGLPGLLPVGRPFGQPLLPRGECCRARRPQATVQRARRRGSELGAAERFDVRVHPAELERRASELVPAAAALLILVGIYANQRSLSTRLTKDTLPVPAANVAVADAGMNDAELLQEVADRAPFMKMQYEDNLRRVNEYILDAQGTVDANPNDAEARRSLMDAYQQKAMLFEMATDRPLR